MSKESREKLKSYFVSNAIPSQSNFENLIDSFISNSEDNITISALKSIGVGDLNPTANLSIKSGNSILTGLLSAKANTKTINGNGTHFTSQLKAGQQVFISGSTYTVKSTPTLDTAFNVTENIGTAFTGVTGSVILDILSVEDRNGNTILLITKDGKIGVKKVPIDVFDVNGNIKATSFQGDGQNITNLQANNLNGVLRKDQLPTIDTSNISGELTITADFSNKINGNVTGTDGTNTLTGTGTNFTEDLKVGESIKVVSTIFTITSINSRTEIEVSPALSAAINNQELFKQSSLIHAQDYQNNTFFLIDNLGNVGIGKTPCAKLDVDGTVQASNFIGDATGLINIPVNNLKGIISKDNLPVNDINHINGLVTINEEYDKSIQGTVSAAKDATTIVGTGTNFTTDLVVGQKILIDNQIYTVAAIGSATSLTIDSGLKAEAIKASVFIPGDLLLLNDMDDNQLVKVDGTGNVDAVSFSGDATGLTNIPAGSIEGTISNDNLPIIDKNHINGLVTINEQYDKAIQGTVSGVKDATSLTGVGTSFDTELVAGQKISIDNQIYLVTEVTSATSITIDSGLKAEATTATVFISGDLLLLKDIDDNQLVKIDGKGKVDAVSFSGNATGLTNIPAGNIEGTISSDNLPIIDKNHINGLVTINEQYDNAIKGTVSGAKDTTSLTGVGTSFDTELVAGRKISVDDHVYTVMEITSATSITIDSGLKAEATTATVFILGDLLLLKDIDDNQLVKVDGTGNIDVTGNITADKLIGDATGLTNIPADKLKGNINITGDIISKSFTGDASGLTNIPGDKITGSINTSGNINGAKFTGDGSGLTKINAANLQGLIPDASIPNIDAKKISGKLSPDQLPDIGNTGKKINVWSETPVLRKKEKALLNWETTGIDELTLQYPYGDTIILKDKLPLQQSNFQIYIYENVTITLTGSLKGSIVSQEQITISVIQGVNEVAKQLCYEGYDLPYTLEMCIRRFKLGGALVSNITKMVDAIANTSYQPLDVFQYVPEYYITHYGYWEDSFQKILLSKIINYDPFVERIQRLMQAGISPVDTAKDILKISSTYSPISMALAFREAGYSSSVATTALKGVFPSLSPGEFTSIMQKVFNKQTPTDIATDDNNKGSDVLVAAKNIMGNFPEIKAQDFAIVLANGGYNSTNTTKALKQYFRRLSPVEFVTIIKKAYNT